MPGPHWQPGPGPSRNVEVKVAVGEFASLRTALAAAGAEDGGARRQVDTYFATPPDSGTRLKLRQEVPGGAELIAYARPDRPGLRESAYRRWPAPDPAGLTAVLALALPPRARVVKRRHLYRLGRTRVHLDEVEGRGCFVELEVVLAGGELASDGEREAESLLARLGLAAAPRIAGSYADL